MKKYCFLICLILFSTVLLSKTTFWISWEGEDWFKEKAREFQNITGEQVEIVYVASMDEKLGVTVRGTDNLPDVCLVKSDQLVLVSEISKETPSKLLLNKYEFDEKLRDTFIMNGKQVSFPFYADVQLMYANRKLLEKLSIDINPEMWNLSYFVDKMKEIRDKGVIPSGWGLNSAYIFMGMQEGLGSEIIDSKGEIKLVTEENKALLEMINNWKKDGYIHDYVQRPDMMKAFLKNRVAMVPQGSFLIQKFNSMNFQVQVLPIPAPWKTVIDPKAFTFFSDNEVAVEFVSFILDDIEEFCSKYIKYPSIKGIYETIPYFDSLKKSYENGYMQPSETIFSTGYWPAIRTALDLFLKGELTAEEALKKAQDFISQK